MNFFRLAAFIAVAITAFACTANNESKKIESSGVTLSKLESPGPDYNSDKKQNDEEAIYSDSTAKQQPPGKTQKRIGQQNELLNKPDWEKKIIKTASLNVEVKDYNTFYTSLREKVKIVGGYVSHEEQTQSDYKIENSVTIKVPVDQFDNALVQFMANTEKINEKKITSQDVTTDIVDTKSRMEAKKQVRLRYMDLLHQAKNMEEILNVQSEINGIQEEIEAAAGRIQYLGHSTTFSTINLTYYQILNSSAKDIDKPSFATKLSSAFNIGWSWIGDFFIGLVSIWPLLLTIAFIVLAIKKVKVKKTALADKTSPDTTSN